MITGGTILFRPSLRRIMYFTFKSEKEKRSSHKRGPTIPKPKPKCCNRPHRQRFFPSARDGGLFERRRQLAPGGPTVTGYPRESTPGRVPWSRARIPAQEALERHTGDPLLDALVQASTGHNAARRPPRPGWSASELRPAPSCMSASAVAAAGPSDGRQSLPSACCRGRARDSCRGAECSGEPGAAWVTKLGRCAKSKWAAGQPNPRTLFTP